MQVGMGTVDISWCGTMYDVWCNYLVRCNVMMCGAIFVFNVMLNDIRSYVLCEAVW